MWAVHRQPTDRCYAALLDIELAHLTSGALASVTLTRVLEATA